VTESTEDSGWNVKRVEDRHKKAGSYTELDSGPSHKGRIKRREWNVKSNIGM
jgi:hypothetical protein